MSQKKEDSEESEAGLLDKEEGAETRHAEEEEPENRASKTKAFIGGTGFSFDITDFFPTKTLSAK